MGIVNKKKTIEQFIKYAIEVHGDKYDYSKVDYINSHTEVLIKCHIHGLFLQIPINHLHGWCIKCSRKGYSLSQIQWLEYISFRDNIKIQHAQNDGE